MKWTIKKPDKKLQVFISSLLALTFSCCYQSAMSQDYIDILKINYNYTSVNTFENSNVKTSIAEIDLEATVPIVLNDHATFVTGLYGEAFRVKLNTDDLSKNIYSMSPKLGVNLAHGAKWSGTYMLLPKIATDFVDVSIKDFQLGGFVLFKYLHKPNLNYKFGVYANSECFGPWVVPLMGLYYLSDAKKIEVNLTLPFSADFNYRAGKILTVGIHFTSMTKSYHITQNTSQDESGYLARASSELFTYASFHFTKTIIVQTKIGHSVGRYYRVFDDDDKVSLGMPLVFVNDNRTQLNSDFTDGWVFQLMAIYRFQLDPT